MVDIREIANPKTTKVFVNGNWVGVHRDPEDLIGKLIDLMRFPLFYVFSTFFPPCLVRICMVSVYRAQKVVTPSFLSESRQHRYISSALSSHDILHSIELYSVMSLCNYSLSTKPYRLISLCHSFSSPFYSPTSLSSLLFFIFLPFYLPL